MSNTRGQFWKITWFDGTTSMWSIVDYTAAAMQRIVDSSQRIRDVELIEA